jgi:phosphoribosylpyrophosphate synthetase
MSLRFGHVERRRRRGYDQAVRFADAATATLGIPAVVALARERATLPQFELGRERRAENVADAFRVYDASRRAVAGRWIVLVDDVATTGATLVACAHALLAEGAAASRPVRSPGRCDGRRGVEGPGIYSDHACRSLAPLLASRAARHPGGQP